MTKDATIEKMNYYGKNGIPFLFIIDFEMNNSIVEKLDEINNTEIKYSFNERQNFLQKEEFKLTQFEIFPPNYEDFLASFEIVRKNILKGNSYLVNLTRESELMTNLNLEEIFLQSRAKYKLLYKDKFTFFSPEIFVKIKGNKIFSYPMKGTIDASIDNAEEILMKDKKELAEHFTIVDLIRNDLNIVAKKVKVEKFRFLDLIETNKKSIFQVSSEISGELPENFNETLGEIIFKLLPAGSISGAPKKKTLEIIKSAEKNSRGFYTGIAGIFDGKELDSCVMIRFIEQKNAKLFYKSGGGITSKSIPENEYEELINKIYIPRS